VFKRNRDMDSGRPQKGTTSGRIVRGKLMLLFALGAAAVVGQSLGAAPLTTTVGGGSTSSSGFSSSSLGAGSTAGKQPLSGSQSKAEAATLLAAGANQAEHPAPIHAGTWRTSSSSSTTKPSTKNSPPPPTSPSAAKPPASPTITEAAAIQAARTDAKRAAKGKEITGFKKGVSQAIPLLDNATTNTYANADGTLTAQVYQAPVNYENTQGRWVPIVDTLHAAANGSFESGAGPTEVSFAPTLASPEMVTVTDGDVSFGLAPPEQASESTGGSVEGATPAQPVHGSLSGGTTVTYANAWPGTNLEGVWSAAGLSQLVVLQQPPTGTGDVVYRYQLSTDGLTPQLTSTDSLDLVNTTGTVVFTMPPGWMADSAGNPQSATTTSNPLAYTLGPHGKWLDVIASGAWLRDPARVYPVTIDPNFGTAGDVGISTYSPNLNYNGNEGFTLNGYSDYTDYIGEYSGSTTGMNWALMDYNVTQLDGATILNATWNGYFDWTDTCAPEEYWVWRATNSWNYQTATWNNFTPGSPYSTTDGVTGSVAANWGGNCPGYTRNWSSVTITPWVTDWTQGTANDGIVINSGGSANTTPGGPASSQFWMQVAAWDTNTGNPSYLSITYSPGPAPALASPSSGAQIVDPNLEPTLSVSTCASCIQYDFQVSTSTSFSSLSCASGWTSATWTVPVGCLLNGGTYYWQAIGWNGLYINNQPVTTNWSSPWSFTASTGPGDNLSSPPNGGVVVDPDLQPPLTASRCSECAQYYFELSTNSQFPTGSYDGSGPVNSPSWSPPAGAIADGQTYYWRVEGITSQDVVQNWSPTWSFSVSGPVNWGFQDSAANPSLSSQSGNQPFPGPSDTATGTTLPVYVVNQTLSTWTPTGSYQISYHVLNPANQGVVANGVTASPGVGTMTMPPVTVISGSGVWVNVNIASFASEGLSSGSYELAFDIFDSQLNEWFSQGGGSTAAFDMLVGTPPSPSSPAGGATITPGSGGALQPTLAAGNCTSCTGYQFQVSTRSEFGAYVTTSPWLSSPSWTVPGGDLKAGATYYWRVIGRDQYQSSTAWSNSATFVTPTTPGTPTAVSATGGSAKATLTWTTPASSGGSAITGYSIVPSLNGRPQTPVSASSSPTTLTGLTNGGSYTFTVAATNLMGTGVPSTPSAAAIPSKAPAAPGGVTAEAGSSQVTVSWQAAASNGSAVTGYTVTTYVGGTASGTTSAGASATSAIVGSLTNGTSYTFAVSAANGDGQGAASAQTAVVTPGAAPSVSVSLDSSQYSRGQTATITATIAPASSSSETVNLALPLAGIGFDTTGYTVSVGGTSCKSVAGVTCSISSSDITVSGLTVTSAGLTVAATVRALGSDSTCTQPVVTATVTDATTGRGGLGSVQGSICDGGLGAHQWWTFVSTALGPAGTAEVNAANGNLVVTQQDGGTMQLHGNLSLGIVRAFNSEATLQPAAEPVGLGWITSFVSAGDDLGGVALRVPSGEHVSGGAAITVITDSGAQDVFEPTTLASAIDVTTLGTTTGPLGPLVPTTLALGTGYNQLCVDNVYTPEAGVHASMWRYVESSTGACTGLTSSNAAVLGYATLTTDGVRREYNATGELLSVRDAQGNRVDFTYSGTKLTRVGETGGSSRAYTLSYTTWSGGVQVNIADPAGEVTSYQENSAGDLVNVLNPSGSSLHYTYGACGGSTPQLCSAQNPDGNTVTFSYQGSPFGGPAEIYQVTGLQTTTSPQPATTYNYGANGAVVSAITGTEEEHFAQVDALGRVGEVDEGSTTQGAAGVWLHTTLYEWDTSTLSCQHPDAGPDNELCDILELGLDNGQTPNRETQYTYNDEGAILVQDDLDSPTNVVTTTSYLAQYVESNGTVRTFTDTVAGSGAVTSQAGPRLDASTVLVLSAQTAVLSPDGNAATSGYASYETTYTRDTNTAVGAGLPIGSANPCAGAGDNTGLLCTESAPSKDGTHATVTTYTYDQWGQRLTATTPDESDGAQTGSPTTYTYYPDTATDLSGTTHEGGWLAGVTDPTGQFVAYGYDAEGQVVRTWARNATAQAGLPLSAYPGTCASATAPDYTQTLYATSCSTLPGLYVLSQTDPLGNVTTYQVDNDGNRLGVRTPRGNQGGVGYPQCPTVGADDTCSTYNDAGEVLTVQQPVEALKTLSPHTTNTYDAYGNLVQTTDAAGDTTTATYDAANRKVTVTVARYAVGSTLYSAAGSDAVPTGCTTSASAPWPSGGEVVCTTTTAYDGEDNVINVQSPAWEVSDVVGSAEPTVTTYVYDGYHRVIETIAPRWDGTNRTVTTASVYDPDGNILESCPANEFAEGSGGCHGPGSTTTDHFSTYTTYNAADLPISVSTYTANTPLTGTPAPAVVTTSYDADGNVLSTTNADGATTSNDYSVLDRLVWTGTPQSGNHYVVTWYGYDPSGNKTWTTQTTAISTGLPAAGVTAPSTLSGARDTIVSYNADNRPLDTVVAAKSTAGTPNVCFDNFPSFGVTGISGCPNLGVTNGSGGVNVHTRVSYDADGNKVAEFTADAFQNSATTPSAEYMVRTDYDADDRAVTQYVPRFDTADTNETPLGVTSVFSGQASQGGQCPVTGSISIAPSGVGAPQTIAGVPAYDATTGLCATAVQYNGDGQVVKELMPTAGGNWSSSAFDTYAYTDDGLAATAGSPNPSGAGGQVTTSAVYDAQGKELVSTDAEGNQTTSVYSADGLLLSTTAPPSNSLTLSSTSNGPTAVTVDPADTTTYGYDAAGNQVTVTDGYGASTVTQYTVDGRKQSVSTPSGNTAGTPEVTTYTYDPVGNTLTATSPNGYPTAYTYSENNLLLTTVTPPGSGGAGLETDDSYDGLGETVSEHTYEVGITGCPVGGPPSTACDGGTISESFYLDGRLETETPEAAAGDTAPTPADTFTYDASGNEIGASNVVSGGTSGATDTVTYYLDGSVRSVDDGAGDAQISGDGGPTMAGYAAELSYDGAGSIATLTLNRDGGSQTSTEALAYNAAEDAVTLGTTADAGLNETRVYTADGQLTNQIQTNGDVTTFTYNPNGSVQQDWLCGSTTSPSGTCASGSNDILGWWAYSYDSNGQQSASEAAPAGENTILEDAYYPDGRVESYSTASEQAPTSGQFTSVNYDNDGNRIMVTSGGQQTTYSYNSNDSLSSTGTVADSYDADGRLLSDGCSSYTYDGFNQTATSTTTSTPPAGCGSTTASGATATTYDALGRTLTSDQTQTQNGNTATTFWVDHYASTGSLLALLQKDTSTSGAGDNDLTLLVGSSGTPSQVISSTGGSQWYTNDGQGNVGAVTGSASGGAAVCALEYDIYGSPLQPTSSINPCVGQTSGSVSPSLTEFGYQFAQRDPTTGDYAFGARQYDPTKAAFTTPDSYQPGSTGQDVSIGTDPLTEDSYAYANADPINLKDPTGHGIAGDEGGSCGSVASCSASNGGTGSNTSGGGSSASGNSCGNSCQQELQVANNYYQQQQQQAISTLASNSAQAVAASSGCNAGCQSEMQVYAAATPVFTAAYDYQQAQQVEQVTLTDMAQSSQAQYQSQLTAATTEAADAHQIGAYFASLTSCNGLCQLGQMGSNEWTSIQQTFHPSPAEMAHGLPTPTPEQIGSDFLQLGLLMIPVGGEAADAATDATGGAGDLIFSGHGAYDAADGLVTMPKGTTLTFFSEDGQPISDALGNAIETGHPEGLAQFGETYLPGAELPNYTLYPPDGLTIAGNPVTVTVPTRLSELLQEGLGRCTWAACR